MSINVKVVSQGSGNTALVEYMDEDGIHRVTIPTGEIHLDGRVTKRTLDAGIPYGVAWEDLIRIEVTPAKIAAALRAKGIWTVKDARKNAGLVRNILQGVYGVDLGYILSIDSKE